MGFRLGLLLLWGWSVRFDEYVEFSDVPKSTFYCAKWRWPLQSCHSYCVVGERGAGLMLLLLFMAVTSSTPAELIAVSSLLTFDVYKTYVRPKATSTELVRISHYGIILFSLVLAAFCCILNAASIKLTWLLTVLGIIVGGAATPVGLISLWSRMSTVAVLFSPWIGFGSGLIAWFVVTHLRSGAIKV
jgi:Na+/proline symporter